MIFQKAKEDRGGRSYEKPIAGARSVLETTRGEKQFFILIKAELSGLIFFYSQKQGENSTEKAGQIYERNVEQKPGGGDPPAG